MKKLKRGRLPVVIGGLAAGLVNGLLGSGGGMVAVPALEKAGVDANRAHATSVAIMLPLSAVSAFVYLRGGHAVFSDALPYLPGGVIGALAGVLLLRRIPSGLLRRIFGGVAVYSGFRLLLG